MADILKSVSLQHSNSDSGSSPMKLGVQAVGFLSVLAISGSLAYLSRAKVGKQQLWPQTHLSLFLNDDGSRNSTLDSSISVNSKKMTKKMKKKVRFAPDVVDPPGDGKEYRRRHHENPQQQQHRSHSEHQSRINHHQQINHAHNYSGSAYSRIPANRLELYKGLQRSRLEHASFRL